MPYHSKHSPLPTETSQGSPQQAVFLQPLVTSEFPRYPVKPFSFTKETGGFSGINKTIPFPRQRCRAGSCPVHHVQPRPLPQRRVLLPRAAWCSLPALLVSLEVWSPELHHEGADAVWRHRLQEARAEGAGPPCGAASRRSPPLQHTLREAAGQHAGCFINRRVHIQTLLSREVHSKDPD